MISLKCVKDIELICESGILFYRLFTPVVMRCITTALIIENDVSC